MALPIDTRWGVLALFEYEYSTRLALKRLRARRELNYLSNLPPSKRRKFVDTETVRFICQSLGQGKEYFKHAESSDWKIKPLLLYYGMLSVVKGVLAFDFPDYFANKEHLHHGLTIGSSVRQSVELRKDSVQLKPSGVFQLARRSLAKASLPAGFSITLHEIITRLAEIDGTYRLLFRLPQAESNTFQFLNRANDVLLLDQSTGQWYVRLVSAEQLYRDFLPKLNIEFLKEFKAEPPQSGQSWQNLIGQTRSLNRAAIEAVFYRHCVSSADGVISTSGKYEYKGAAYSLLEIELQYLIMFYLSNLARYQPHIWSEVLSGISNTAAVIIKEVVQNAENGFLALLQHHLHLVPYIT